eukprot:189302_1
MGNSQSKQLWKMYSIEMSLSTAAYMLLYYYIVKKSFRKGLPPKVALSLTTNVGSTINAILASLFWIFYFIDKRWKEPIKGDGKITAHLYCVMTSYFMVDAFLFIYFYLKYPSKIVPRHYLMLLHQFIALSPMFVLGIPDPIYCWNPLSIIPVTELSTIFLNIQLFANYFGHSN